MMFEIRYPHPDLLPIVGHREEIIDALQTNRVLIVSGETGSGKTTQLPKICLEAGRGRRQRIGCTQPRRIAAITIAERVGEELGPQGQSVVGYKIRFQDRTTRSTRIKFMTDGILLAEAQRDGRLSEYDTLIIDEAHERSLNIDFLLGMLQRLLETREDLKVVVTSATIDTEKFSKAFGGAPVVAIAGRTYPVEVRYRPLDPDQEEEGEQTYVDQAVRAVLDLREADRSGDMLVFMPTERDIRETAEALDKAVQDSVSAKQRPLILPLFGRLSPGDQKRIFQPAAKQKIVIATNIAETSITVPGIRYVVDTGLARIAMYNPRARTSKLPVLAVSRASCDQRKGRCGRVGPGVCVRLYSEEDHAGRPEFTPPEILRANLAEVILRMTALNLGDPEKFPFVDPPSKRAIKDGYALLEELGALDNKRRLTVHGRLMARLPLDPRISRMVIEARENNALREVAVIAAALSIQDPRVRPADQEKEADGAHARFVTPASDFLFFLALWDAYHTEFEGLTNQAKRRKFCKAHFLSFQRMREWRDIHEQISLILAEEKGFAINSAPAGYDAIHKAILSGSLRNIALKKEKNTYQGAGGHEVTIFPGSSQFNKAGQWIMAAELVETGRLYARTVAAIKPEWLEPLAGSLCRSSYSDPHWEKKMGQVVAFEKVQLFGLVIVARRRINFGRIKPAEARGIFIQAALVEGELKGEYDFLQHNQGLVQELQDMEDKVRRRDIMVDDYTLFRFYDERLPENVMDQQSLNRLIKTRRGHDFLSMTIEDILLQPPDSTHLEQFPETLEIGEVPVRLTYKFALGEEDDGVSALVPVNLLPYLRREFFEWLVPGLLQEKLIFLLKSLPKAQRKHLVPIPDTAKFLATRLIPYQGSLYSALGRIIDESYRLRIDGASWAAAQLPPHLRFRFCLMDSQGNILKATRDLEELRQETPAIAPTDNALVAGLRAQWELAQVGPQDLVEMPERFPVTDARGLLHGFLYPGLAIEDNETIARRLFPDPGEAKNGTRSALLALYRKEFGKQLKALRQDFLIPRSHWALYEGLGGHESFNNELFDFMLGEIFSTRDGRLITQSAFAGKVDTIRQTGLYAMGREISGEIVRVLEERRAALDAISRYQQLAPGTTSSEKKFQGYRRQVAALVPADFLRQYDRRQLANLARYLKALCIRIERAHVAPGKDEEKARSVAPHEQRLESLAGSANLSEAKRTLAAQYREMLEEFKVSLFAQELKTAYPVSAKRLDEKWREVELAA